MPRILVYSLFSCQVLQGLGDSPILLWAAEPSRPIARFWKNSDGCCSRYRSTASRFSTTIRRRCFAVIIAAFGRFMRRSRTQKHFNRHMYSRCMVRSGAAVARALTLGVQLQTRKRNFHLSQTENHHFALCLQGCDRFHPRKNGEPPEGKPISFSPSLSAAAVILI